MTFRRQLKENPSAARITPKNTHRFAPIPEKEKNTKTMSEITAKECGLGDEEVVKLARQSINELRISL